MYNTTTIFAAVIHQAPLILTVKANGGSVVFAIEHSPGVFVTAETFTADSAKTIYTGSARFRLTPAGGAEFNLV